MRQRDESDSGISSLLFDGNNKERFPWLFCSNSSVPRSEVLLFAQANIKVLMIILCFTMFFPLSESSEEKLIWIALLSSLVGYFRKTENS